MAELEVIRSAALAGVSQGFFGRRGGVSTGLFAGLNCGLGSGDDPQAIAENRALAGSTVLPGARVVGVCQIHSPDCVILTEPWEDDARPEADALVTDRPDALLAILTADCAPVLLADREAGVVGAAHAGWKGALGGVTDNAVAAMERLGARRSRIGAAIGPCIAQASYEVDENFRTRFLHDCSGNGMFFAPGLAGHWQFDLEGYVAHRLESAGLGRVDRLSLDTRSQEERFYSYRRATLRGETAFGRQISLIGLSGNGHGES